MGIAKWHDDDVTDTPVSGLLRRFAIQRDPVVRATILVRYRWIAVQAARRFDHRGEPFDDLLQVATVGLMKAIERFEPEFGNGFVAFATPTVIGEIKRHFRDATWSAQVPRRVKELHASVRCAVRHLEAEHGRSPRLSEVALATGLDVERVVEVVAAANAYRALPLNGPAHGSTPRDPVAPDGELGGVIDRTAVRQILATLPARDRRIVELRYYQQCTQSEIAARLGISQVHVGRLLNATLVRLRSLLADTGT
jgi:RNA polymerase sigma-B factor